MKFRKRVKLTVEMLEDRLTPSLTIMTDSFGNLTLSGTPDTDPSNAVALTDTVPLSEAPGGLLTVSETNGTAVTTPVATIFAPGNVTVNFSQSALNDNVDVELNGNTLGGSLSINTGIGND